MFKELKWTDEKISRFWDFEVKYRNNDDIWFTNQVGDGLIKYSFKNISIKKNMNVLDYGAGKGFLTKKLLDLCKAKISVLDFSEESIIHIKNQFEDISGFEESHLIRKLPSDIKSNSFDVVFLVEVIEHLNKQYLNETFEEIYRILKPGGILITTTPNDEKLEESIVCCPNCNEYFHKMQHMRKFNLKSINEFHNQFGFKKLKVSTTNFAYYNNNSILNYLKRKVSKLLRRKDPHLIYIGKK